MAHEEVGKESLGAALGRRCVKWTDRTGRVRQLGPPGSLDILEMVDEFGEPHEWGLPEKSCAKIWATLIWKSLRKEGLSLRQAYEQKWTMSLDDAAELVSLGTATFATEDIFGGARTLHPLTLRDLIEIESKHGRCATWVAREYHPMAFLAHLIWCSARKDGKTPEQVSRGDYAMDERESALAFHPSLAGSQEFRSVFDSGKIEEVTSLWVVLLRGAGIELKPDPQSAAAASDLRAAVGAS